MKAKLEKWHIRARRVPHIKTTRLWLYPELDCSSCVDDVYPASGEEQLAYYCEYIRTGYGGRYRHWWDDDAVPIYWSVMGDGDGFGSEQAPFHHPDFPTDTDDVLTHYYPPVNVRTGAPVNWYTSLPVTIGASHNSPPRSAGCQHQASYSPRFDRLSPAHRSRSDAPRFMGLFCPQQCRNMHETSGF